MQKRKRRYQIWLLLGLGLLAGAIYLLNQKNSSLQSSLKDFALKAPNQLEKIRITKNDTTLQLYKEQRNAWLVNDQYPVNNQALKAMKRIFSGLETVAPLPKIDQERITANLFENGTRIDLYKHTKPFKTYYLYYDTIHSTTYGSLGNKNTVFSLRVRAVDIQDITKYLNTNPGYWKDKHIFKYTPEAIKAVHVQYPDHPENAFTIDNEQQQPVLYDHTGKTIQQVNTEKITNYLYFFSSVKFESVVDPSDNSFSSPFARVHVKHETDTARLHLYRLPSVSGEYKYDLNELLGKTDFEYGRLKYSEVDPILQKINYFRKK